MHWLVDNSKQYNAAIEGRKVHGGGEGWEVGLEEARLDEEQEQLSQVKEEEEAEKQEV